MKGKKLVLGIVLLFIAAYTILLGGCALLLLAALPAHAKQKQQSYIDDSRILVAERQYEQAIALLERGVEVYPKSKPIADELQKVKEEYKIVSLERARQAQEQEQARRAERQRRAEQEAEREAEQKRIADEQKEQDRIAYEARIAQRRQQQKEINDKIKALVRLNGSYVQQGDRGTWLAFRFIETPETERRPVSEIAIWCVTYHQPEGYQLYLHPVTMSDNNISIAGNASYTVSQNGATISSQLSSTTYAFQPSSPSLSNREFGIIAPARVGGNSYIAFGFLGNRWSYETPNRGISTTGYDGSPLTYTYSNGVADLYIQQTRIGRLFEVGKFLIFDFNSSIYQEN
jgi:hypothetical protein